MTRCGPCETPIDAGQTLTASLARRAPTIVCSCNAFSDHEIMNRGDGTAGEAPHRKGKIKLIRAIGDQLTVCRFIISAR
jgi:hypothetical protein